MISSRIKNDRRLIRTSRIFPAATAVLTMLALKRHYSMATADQLDWILAPTATLLAWLTPAHPVYESGVGYADFAHGIIVAPACAGVNFMIMAFGLSAFCSLAKIRRITGMWVWLSISLAGAYGYTIMINTVRIYISMVLYKAGIYGGWVTIERVHRLAGIGLYLGTLWIFFISFQRLIHLWQGTSPEISPGLPVWLPLCWYMTGAAGVPLANLLFKQGAPLLVEHLLTVMIIAPCIWGITVLVHRLLVIAWIYASLPYRSFIKR